MNVKESWAMNVKEQARELVGDAVQTLAEEGGKGSIPGPVIGWLIKKGEIKAPGRKRGGKLERAKKASLKRWKENHKRKLAGEERRARWAREGSVKTVKD